MAEQMRPASPQQAPDPSHSYERSHPGREAGMGRLDSDKAVPSESPDKGHEAVGNRQDGTKQVNAHDAVNQRGGPTAEGRTEGVQCDFAVNLSVEMFDTFVLPDLRRVPRSPERNDRRICSVAAAFVRGPALPRRLFG